MGHTRLIFTILGFSLSLTGSVAVFGLSPELTLGSETSTPFGWIDFCQRNPALCDDNERTPEKVFWSTDNLKKIRQINVRANKAIKPITDPEHWGIPEQWDLPRGQNLQGDCEDYAIYKRQRLLEAGFPRSALLLAKVRKENEDHAILVVRTDRGDFVLDNLTDEILTWRQSKYQFQKMQAD